MACLARSCVALPEQSIDHHLFPEALRPKTRLGALGLCQGKERMPALAVVACPGRERSIFFVSCFKEKPKKLKPFRGYKSYFDRYGIHTSSCQRNIEGHPPDFIQSSLDFARGCSMSGDVVLLFLADEKNIHEGSTFSCFPHPRVSCVGVSLD